MSDEISLECATASARIALVGAELQDWSIGGSPILWDGNPAFWAARSPVLFPVVGWTRGGAVRVGGHSYPLSLHGFAKDCRFEVTSGDGRSARFALRDDRTTRELYPFAFLLELEYRLSATSLVVEMAVTNTGSGPMPYAAGLHPGFRLPLPRGDGGTHSVIFESEERSEVPVIAPGGLFSANMRPIEITGREVVLSEKTFSREALCFVGAASRSLRFGCSGAWLDVEFHNLPNIVLWSRPKAPFLCIEGWSGTGDPEHFEGDLFEKPGMTILQAGEVGRHAMGFTFHHDP